MKAICDGFDRFVKDFYPFAIKGLQLRVDPPLTRVLVVCDPGEMEDWEKTLRFVEKVAGMPEDWTKDAEALWWMMPETTREERLKLGPNVLSDAWVDYDAYIVLHQAKLCTDHNTLNAREFYHAMSSACIQLAGAKAHGLTPAAGKVAERDPQALKLLDEFCRNMAVEEFVGLYAPPNATF